MTRWHPRVGEEKLGEPGFQEQTFSDVGSAKSVNILGFTADRCGKLAGEKNHRQTGFHFDYDVKKAPQGWVGAITTRNP
jgi:hypothetical protein